MKDHLDDAHSHESEANGVKSKFREQFPRLKKRLADREVQTDMVAAALVGDNHVGDRKSTRLNSSHV